MNQVYKTSRVAYDLPMKIFSLAAAGVMAFAITPHAAADELPPEVVACLAYYPGAVTLGQETAGPDIVCLANDQGMPGDSDWQDTYYTGIPWTLTPPPPPPVPEPVVEEPVTTPEALPAPEDVTARVADTSLARTSTATVRVTYDAVEDADAYTVKCGTQKVKTERLRAKVRKVTSSTCRVKAVDGVWSKRVQIRR